MKTTNFIRMTGKHYESAKKIYEDDGSCSTVRCKDCPFGRDNAVNGKHCTKNFYVYALPAASPNELAKKSAKDFIELYEKEEK